MNQRQLFLQHNAQTSTSPVLLDVKSAEGIYITDTNDKKYTDLISGISVCNMGHSHPKVLEAIALQSKLYMHTMVYGEFVQSPQVLYAAELCHHLPDALNCVYFTNSGSEATEGAMKLAKRYTGRTKIISFNKSYHGSTQGALSIMGDEYFRNAFRPLLPEVYHYDYQSNEAIAAIDENTAAVVVEIVQAESGIHSARKEWLWSLYQKCKSTGTLLIADEIQSGLGRTGKLFAFEWHDMVPDILLLGKALGAGLPLGAFIASHQIMQSLTCNPVLGHITTFGGNPVCCAAGLAGFRALISSGIIDAVAEKEKLFKSLLTHQAIKEIRSAGLLMAVEFDQESINQRVIQQCLQNGLITDWFLFAPQCLRIAPPLIIDEHQIIEACRIILKSIQEVTG